MASAFAAFVVYDLRAGVPLLSLAWFIPADTVEVLLAAYGLRYFFDGVPQLNSVRGFARYLFVAVILAPLAAAFISARGFQGGYWNGWRISFFSEVLALLTLTPVILSWAVNWRAWMRKSRGYHLEATAMITGLVLLSYLGFTSTAGSTSPALLYSLVPLLLWSALRFGLVGTSSAVMVVSFFSIWGAVHGRGPFIEPGQHDDVVSLQVFLIFTATTFLFLAALAEETKKSQEAVRKREEELIQAQRVAQVGNWQWDPKTDLVTWSKELYRITGLDPNRPPLTYGEQQQLYTAESWECLKRAVAKALETGAPYKLDLQMVRPDGSTRWITDRGEALHDEAGRITGLRGTAQDITERKHAEEELRASKDKFRNVFRDARVGMVIVSPEGHFLAANEAFCECLGYTEDEVLQRTVQSITLAEDWPSFSRRLAETLERGTGFRGVENHCLHKSGRILTTESSVSLIRGANGEPEHLVGEILDITQRKVAEEALSGVSRRLIEAHEEERTWIARELHDDFNQRLALLAATLESMRASLPASQDSVQRHFEEASRQVSELGTDIHALSHRLHSSKLEYLGFVAAARGFCRELSERQSVEIDFQSEEIPKSLSKEISLCLFRILQEALQNAIKHSGTQRFEVCLTCAANEIQLSVHDSGNGFDPGEAIKTRGIGLISMKERVKLVHGQLDVESKPQVGTIIHARVPLEPRMKSAGVGA